MFLERFMKRIIIYTAIFIGVVAPSAFAGQSIVIDGSYSKDVSGNSSNADYSGWDSVLATFGNRILVTSNANMNGKSIYGAYHKTNIKSAELYNNQIDILGGINLGSVSAGHLAEAYGNFIVHHNTLNIHAGSFTGSGTTLMGGFNDSENNQPAFVQDTNYNVVNINNGTFVNGTLLIYGAHSKNDDHSAAGGGQNIFGNVVSINDGTFTNSSDTYVVNIYGGYARGGSYVQLQNIRNNRVDITGGTFDSSATTHNMEIYGGYSEYTGANQDVSADVSGNIVSITGGTFSGANMIICGGVIESGTATSTASATNNIVRIGGSAVFNTSNIILCGGADLSDPDGSLVGRDVLTGNTLNMRGSITANELKNFDKYDFYVPAGMPDGGTMLTLNGSAALTGTASGVRVGMQSGNRNLLAGYKVILVDDIALNGGVEEMFKNFDGNVYSEDIKVKYIFDTILDDFQFIIILVRVEDNRKLKLLANGMLSGMAAINQGEDIVQDHLASYSNLNFSSAYGLKFFNNSKSASATQYTNDYRDMPVSQNNKIESDSLTQITGGSYSKYGGHGLTNIGAFYESGASSYKSRDVYDDFISLNGVGRDSYRGGGIFGRQEFGGAGNSRVYVEAAGRVGEMDIDYSTDWQDLGTGRYMGYSISPMYYGMQGGVGYIWKEKSGKGNKAVKLSAKYLQTTLQGESLVLPSENQLEFDDVTSKRLQTGVRFSYLPIKGVDTYIGAAYERELDGEVRSKIDGDVINPQDVKGGTVIGDVGVVLGKLPVTLGLSLKGSVGKREDFSANTELTYDF